MKQRNLKNELKEKTDLLKEYISMIPTGYTFENETAKKVFAVLYYYYVHNGKVPFSIGIRTIADDALMSRTTTNRNVNLLIDKYNYIECEKGHRNVNSTYNILPCPTECPNQCPTLIKNDMGQQELVGQQNGTAKMIHSGTGNIVDNEIVTDIELDEVGQSQSDNGDFDDLGHKYKYKYNLKHKLNIPNSNNSNKHKILNNDMEKENKEKVNVTLNSKEAINEIAVAIAENIVGYLDKNWKEKVTQLEEVVNKQNETISLLTSRLDKASKFCADMHKQLSSQSNLSKDSNSGIADSRPYVNLSIEDKNNLYEYNKAIQEFYDLKDLDIAKAEEKLHILNTLYDKLPQEKQLKISRAREVFEDKKKFKNSKPQTADFYALQTKFYETLKENSQERNTKLVGIFKAIENLNLNGKEKGNLEKIELAFADALRKDNDLKRKYKSKLIEIERLWTEEKNHDKRLELAQKYLEEYDSYNKQPECILKALQMRENLNMLWSYIKTGKTYLHSDILDFIYENRLLRTQKEVSGTTVHQEEEKPSDGLKTAKNEASKDMPADVEVIEDFKGPDEETLKQIYEKYAVAN